MTWKSTAAVSGLGLLATWLASTPTPPVARIGVAPAPNVSESTATSGADIAQQADRLAYRLRGNAAFEAPSRNLFRFEGGRIAHQPQSHTAVAAPVAEDLKPEPPAALRITLAGVATDSLDGNDQRTAILGTPTGILIVHEGDSVAGQYRVGAIQEAAVELIRLDDGGVLRLTMGR